MAVVTAAGQSGAARAARWLAPPVLVLVLATLLLISTHALTARLDYDEGYNLQVAESLRRGDGYATFGALRDGEPWLFDPHISTGPTVLLPAAAVWALTNASLTALHATLLMFLWAYALGWFLLLEKGERRLLLFGLALIPALAASSYPAGRLLGELPGAALLVWAAVALEKRRWALAGLAIGLAIQAKVTYAAGAVALLATWLLLAVAGRRMPRFRTVVLMAACTVLPSLLFEAFRLWSFASVDAYLASLREYRDFLASQRIANWLAPATLGQKLVELYVTLPLSAWAVLVGLMFVAVPCMNQTATRPQVDHRGVAARDAGGDAARLASFWMLLMAGLVMLALWITESIQTSVRQGLPFLLLSLPAILALGLLPTMRALDRARATSPGRWGALAIRLGLAFVVLAMVATAFHTMQDLIQDRRSREAATEQQEVAGLIRSLAPDSMYVDGWWQNPEYQILAPVDAVPWRGGRQLLVVQDYQVGLTKTDWEDYTHRCGEVVRRTPFTLVCWLREVGAAE